MKASQEGGVFSFFNKKGKEELRYLDVADICGMQVGIVGTRNLEDARTQNRVKEGAAAAAASGKKTTSSKVDQEANRLVSILYNGGDQSLDVLCDDVIAHIGEAVIPSSRLVQDELISPSSPLYHHPQRDPVEKRPTTRKTFLFQQFAELLQRSWRSRGCFALSQQGGFSCSLWSI